jgi:methionyl-tRNA formyltransferase
MDAGPVFAQSKPFPLAKDDKQGLAQILLHIGAQLLIKNLPAILDGSLQPTPQDETKATYDKLIEKKDAILDFQKDAEQLEREIRAYAIWPKSRTTIGDVDVAINEANVVPIIGVPGTVSYTDSKLLIACKKFSLEIKKLTPAGKKEMTAQAFLNGYKI